MGKEVYLVLDNREILLTGVHEQVVTKLYFKELSEAGQEAAVPDAHQAFEILSDWIE